MIGFSTLQKLALRSVSSVALVAAFAPLAASAAEVTYDRLLNADREPQNWLTHHRTYDGQRYSPLTAITKENVKNLRLAYAIPLGGTRGNEYLESTPLVANGFLYATDSLGWVYKVDVSNGEYGRIVWHMDPSQQNLSANRGVALAGNLVISVANGPARAVATNTDTGEVVWKADLGTATGGHGYSSAVKATVNDVPMYVALLGQTAGVVGVHAETGKLLWQYKGVGSTGGVAQIPIPIVKGDKVWVSCSYNPPGAGSALLQLVPKGKDAFDVKVVKTYEKKEANNHHGGMVLVGDHIYFGHNQNDGNPTCVDMKTGEIKWGPEKNPAGGIHHVCYEVDDILAARDRLKAEGARVLGDGTPKIGAHDKPVLFLHPKDFCGTLVELEQA